MNCYIAGVGSYLPSQILSNKDLLSRIDNFEIERAKNSILKKGIDTQNLTDVEIFDSWVKQVCGIKQRTFVSDNFVAQNPFVSEEMGKRASEKALADARMHADEIDHIVFSSYSSELLIPGSAPILAKLLGIENVSGVNINGACSGFLDALFDACAKIEAGFYKNVLVVASEYISNKMNFNDPTTCIIFADGAGAVVLKKGREGVHSFTNRLKFNDEHIRMERTGLIQMGGGPLVQKNAVTAMSTITEEALDKAGLHIEDCHYIIPHQANIRILNALETRFKAKNLQMIKCIENTGNLSSATIPVASTLR